MKAIFKRELKGYFGGMIAYIVIALITALVSFVAIAVNLIDGIPYFEYTLCNDYVTLAVIISLSLLTMRCFADEKREKTDQLLYSLPLKTTDIVIGKYFAMVTVYLIPVGLMCIWPLILNNYGTVNFLQTYSTLLAHFLLGACIISIGMFLSSLTESQVIAAVMTIGVMLAMFFMPVIVGVFLPSTPKASFICFIVMIAVIALIVYSLTANIYATAIVGVVLELINLILYLVKPDMFKAAFPDILDKLSLFERIFVFPGGMFDITVIVYYLSVTGVFVFLTVQSLEKKRYS